MASGGEPFSLRRRLQLLVAGLVAVLVVGGLNTLRLIETRDRAITEIVEVLDPAREESNRLEAVLIDQQAAVQGFLLTGREETLEPYQRAIDRQVDALNALRALLDRRETSAQVSAIEAAVQEWRATVVLPQISAKRAGREGEVRALTATGGSAFSDARAAVERLQVVITREFVAENERFASARAGVTRTIIANFGVAVLLVAMATVFLRRWVTRPLDELRADVEAVAGGALDQPVGITGPLELVALGRDVDAMRLRILSELDEVRRAQEGLAQRAPVVLALRDALAPTTLRVPPEFSFATMFEPAEGVLAGDWYDAITLPGGRVAVALGDVAGHGAEAGLFAMRAKDLLIAALRLGLPPGEAVGLVAEELGELDEGFVTCVVAVIERSGVFRYANAGHPPPLLATAGDVALLPTTGPLLGPLTATWDTEELALAPGSALVCYTDGVIEAASEDGEEYGIDRLMGVVAATRSLGPKAIIEGCATSLRTHAPATRGRDDITLLALMRARAER